MYLRRGGFKRYQVDFIRDIIEDLKARGINVYEMNSNIIDLMDNIHLGMSADEWIKVLYLLKDNNDIYISSIDRLQQTFILQANQTITFEEDDTLNVSFELATDHSLEILYTDGLMLDQVLEDTAVLDITASSNPPNIDFFLQDDMVLDLTSSSMLGHPILLKDDSEITLTSDDGLSYASLLCDESILNLYNEDSVQITFSIASDQAFVINADEALKVAYALSDDQELTLSNSDNLILLHNLSDNSDLSLEETDMLTVSFYLSDKVNLYLNSVEQLFHAYELKDDSSFVLISSEVLSYQNLLSSDSIVDIAEADIISLQFVLSSDNAIALIGQGNPEVTHNLKDISSLSIDQSGSPTVYFTLQSTGDVDVVEIEGLMAQFLLKDSQDIDIKSIEIISVSYALNDNSTFAMQSIGSPNISYSLMDTASVNIVSTEGLSVNFTMSETGPFGLIAQENLSCTFNLSDDFVIEMISTTLGSFVSFNLSSLAVLDFVQASTISYAFLLKDTCYFDIQCQEQLNSFTLYENETLALFNRTTVYPNYIIRDAANTLVKGLKDAGIWQRLDLLHLLAAPTQQMSLLNWVKDEFNSVVVGAPTFTAYKGWTGAGKGYLNTGMNPSLSTNLYKQNNAFMALRVLNSTSDSILDFGVSNANINSRITVLLVYNLSICANDNGSVLAIGGSGTGGYSWSRDSSGSRLYMNGSPITLNVALGSQVPVNDTFKVCGNGTTSSTSSLGQIAVVAAGSSLTAAQSKTFNDLIDGYLVKVGAI